MAVLLVYALGVAVTAVCIGVTFEHQGGMDFPDALVAVWLGFVWPFIVPIAALAVAVRFTVRAIGVRR